jgi:hypothetical protein
MQAALRGLSVFGDEVIVRNVLSRMESSDFKVRDLALKALLLVSERKSSNAMHLNLCVYMCLCVLQQEYSSQYDARDFIARIKITMTGLLSMSCLTPYVLT